MPQMTSNTVHAARAVTLWSLRAVALWLIAWGLFQIGTRLNFAITATVGQPGFDFLDAARAYTGIGEAHGWFRGLPTLALGIALAFCSARLAVWIIRPPQTGCVSCGHPLAVTDEGSRATCTECGRSNV